MFALRLSTYRIIHIEAITRGVIPPRLHIDELRLTPNTFKSAILRLAMLLLYMVPQYLIILVLLSADGTISGLVTASATVLAQQAIVRLQLDRNAGCLLHRHFQRGQIGRRQLVVIDGHVVNRTAT